MEGGWEGTMIRFDEMDWFNDTVGCDFFMALMLDTHDSSRGLQRL